MKPKHYILTVNN